MNLFVKFCLLKGGNIVEKGGNAGYQHFLLFLQCFQIPSFKFLDCVIKRENAVFTTLELFVEKNHSDQDLDAFCQRR